jgi:hypothetical protein
MLLTEQIKNINMHSKGKPVFRMAKGGDVTKMSRLELEDYITKNYLSDLKSVEMYFNIFETGFTYSLLENNYDKARISLLEYYKKNSDFTESSLAQNSNYKIQDGWEIVEVIKDPETNEVIEERELELISQDNTYNFSYLGIIDLNWRVYFDNEQGTYFYVIKPHKGGDIRGNYGDALILQGEDKEDLFYRYSNEFISGGATIILEFKDGSILTFDSEQDSDVFRFQLVEENTEMNGKIAQSLLKDFNKFDSYDGDEFLQQIVEEFSMANTQKFAGGGGVSDSPSAYIQILGYNEGKYFDLTDYTSGDEVIEGITNYMQELNAEDGGNREEYSVTDFEGFGKGEYYESMGESEFDNIIQGYNEFLDSNFPFQVVEEFKRDTGIDDYTDLISSMNDNFMGEYDDYSDYGYTMVNDGVYKITPNDVYITDTDKRILAGEEAEYRVSDLSFDELLEVAENTKELYEIEKSALELKIEELNDDLSDLQALADDEEDKDYQKTIELIGEKEMLIEEVETEINDLEDAYFDRARTEAQEYFYEETENKLDNDLLGFLEENGYDDLTNVNFLSINYDELGKDLLGDSIVIENNGIYVFSNYGNGGKVLKVKSEKFPYYIIEENNNKIISGYSTKEDAIKNKGNLVREYKGMKFNIYEIKALENKKMLNVSNKADYLSLSDLDSASKIATNPSTMGFVKSKVKNVIRKGIEGTKKGFNYAQSQWRDADFGDGQGKATFFGDGGMADFSAEYNKMNMLVKLKIANVLGIEKALKLMNDYDNSIIPPYSLIVSAVQKDLLSIEEINKDIINEAIYESEDIEQTYRDSGQGIGTSDMNAFVYNMLSSAGISVGVVGGYYKRLDKINKEKIEQEKIEEERAEQVRIEQEKIEQERIEQETIEQERLEQEKIQETINSNRIIKTPSNTYLIVSENNEIIKENGLSKHFETKQEAQQFILSNLSSPNKANIGLVIMATELVQKQQKAQKEAQAEAQQQAELQAQQQAQQQAEFEAKEQVSTEIITDNSIEVNAPLMESGGIASDSCIELVIRKANEFQKVRYSFTDKNKLVLMFETEPTIEVIEIIQNILDNDKDCMLVFGEQIEFSAGESKNTLAIPIIVDGYTHRQLNNGGKVLTN